MRGQPFLLFLGRLALACGEWDIEAFTARIPIRVVNWWMAYWQCEPWGAEWHRSGKLATAMAAAMGSDVPADFVEKFLPTYREKLQTKQQMLEQLRKIPAFAAQMEEKGL